MKTRQGVPPPTFLIRAHCLLVRPSTATRGPWATTPIPANPASPTYTSQRIGWLASSTPQFDVPAQQ